MTNPNLTHLTLIVDRSGSMHGIHTDMNGAILSLLEAQSNEPGDVVVDVVTFDNVVEYPYTGVDPLDVKGDVIEPRGSTALNDAIGLTTRKNGRYFASLAEEDRPGTVIVVVVTDGMENASREYTTEQVKAMVTEQTEQWGWTFMYLAANVDAFATGSGYGFAPGQTMAYAASSKGSKMSMSNLHANASRARRGDSSGFTEEERASSMEE
jgi:Mg-chelatase subunit ChlD